MTEALVNLTKNSIDASNLQLTTCNKIHDEGPLLCHLRHYADCDRQTDGYKHPLLSACMAVSNVNELIALIEHVGSCSNISVSPFLVYHSLLHFLETAFDEADSRNVQVLLMTMVLLELSESTQKYPSLSN